MYQEALIKLFSIRSKKQQERRAPPAAHLLWAKAHLGAAASTRFCCSYKERMRSFKALPFYLCFLCYFHPYYSHQVLSELQHFTRQVSETTI